MTKAKEMENRNSSVFLSPYPPEMLSIPGGERVLSSL